MICAVSVYFSFKSIKFFTRGQADGYRGVVIRTLPKKAAASVLMFEFCTDQVG
jgi:hypothetical protein